jgi:hypothetical protein
MWIYFGLDGLEPVKLHMSNVVMGVQPTMLTAGGATDIMRHNLPKLLQMTASALATNPRDKVYALLSLVPPERTVIKVDYSKTPAEVYADFVLSEIQVTRSLSPLYMLQDEKSQRATKDIPSWVPDLGSETSFKSYLDRLSNGDYRAAGASKAEYDVSWRRKTLAVRGLRYCVIAQVDKGATLGASGTDEEIVAQTLPRWFALAARRPPR